MTAPTRDEGREDGGSDPLEVPSQTQRDDSGAVIPQDSARVWDSGAAADTGWPLTRQDLWVVARRTVLLVAALVAGAWLVLQLRAVVMLVLVSIILATGLRPLVARLKDRGVPRGVAVLLIYLGFVLACVGLGFLIVPPLIVALGTLVSNAPGTAERIGAELQALEQQHPFLAPLLGPLTQQAPNIGMQIGALAGEALSLVTLALNVLSAVLTLVLLLLLTFYLVTDGVRIRDYLLSFVAPRHRPHLRELTDRMADRMGGYLLGEVVLSLVVGVVSYAGLRLLGIPGPLILAIVAAIGVAIPIVGPFLAAIPPVLVALTVSPALALVTLIFFFVLIQAEMNLLAPIVLHRAVHIHPVAVLIALLVGGALMGGLGVIVAVPLAAAISVLLDDIRARYRVPEQPSAAAHASSSTSAPLDDEGPASADRSAPEPGEPAPV